MSKHFRKIFLILFAILYISVALVSTFHAISFFGLANNSWVSVMLAITFEIGQAAVLFSILTGASGKNKIIPWVLMCVLTLVQVLGNVFSSYEYLITHSGDNLRFFKEPIFVWTDLPDDQCNVILTYIIGAILPIVALLMTSMVTNYLNKDEEKVEPIKENKDDNPRHVATNDSRTTGQDGETTEPIEANDPVPDSETETSQETIKEPKKESKFINLKKSN